MTRAAPAVRTSLWLVPKGGEAKRRVSTAIGALAARTKTTPFAPHVTLLGSLESPHETVLVAARTLAATLPRLEFRLTGFEFEDVITRCLNLRADLSEELVQAHRHAAELVGVPAETYRPHLSLLYADLPIDERRAMAESLDIVLPMRMTAERLAVWSAATVSPRQWEMLADFPLTGPSPAG